MINPNIVPLVQPGALFNSLISDTLRVRYFVAQDPVFYAVLNRPIADIEVRQLIIAKTLDQINMSLGYQAYFPFLMQPTFVDGLDLPMAWIWDMNVSLPAKWKNVRLAKVMRISGTNSTGTDVTGGTEPITTSYTGKLRFVFTGNLETSIIETALFTADYQIDSALSYQRVEVNIATSYDDSNHIDAGESSTISGHIIFRTMDVDTQEVRDLFDYLAPPTGPTDASGIYITPASYIIEGVISGIYSTNAVPHGTGLLVNSAYNNIPDLGSSVSSWIGSFNYPFRSTADRTSSTLTSHGAVIIPSVLFSEFNITAPAGDEPTGDSSGAYYPVWISKIYRGTMTVDDPAVSKITMVFSTYNVTDVPSTTPIEFAYLTLNRDGLAGDIVPIVPINNLFGMPTGSGNIFGQHFGRGHAMLSNIWGGSSDDVNDFFTIFSFLVGDNFVEYFKDSTILSSYSVSRVPKYSPTSGQAAAMYGTASDRTDLPSYPSATNKFVVENDQGIGDRIDLESQSGITANSDIERYGYTGSLAHRVVKLVVNASGADHDYEQDILPRLRCLLGRDPGFGDFWFDGTRLKFYEGKSWVG